MGIRYSVKCCPNRPKHEKVREKYDCSNESRKSESPNILHGASNTTSFAGEFTAQVSVVVFFDDFTALVRSVGSGLSNVPSYR